MQMGMQEDPLARIEDPTVRRFVRAVVHVRRFLPFYATGLVFAVTMAVVPAMDGGGGTPASLAGSGGGGAGAVAGSARASGAGAASGGGGAAVGASRSAGSVGAAFSDVGFDGAADLASSPLESPSSASAEARSGGSPTSGLPGAPADVDTPAEFPETPEPPEPCKLTPPSPAPAVDPARELSSAQDTVEAVAGLDLPADAGETVDPVSQEALCSVPASPVPVPDVPLPAAPVSHSSGLPVSLGWLLQLAFLV
jgi:hypothetical protein